MSPIPDDLSIVKDDMVAFIEGHGLRRFNAYVSDEVANVPWSADEDHPEDEVDLAVAGGELRADDAAPSDGVIRDRLDLLAESVPVGHVADVQAAASREPDEPPGPSIDLEDLENAVAFVEPEPSATESSGFSAMWIGMPVSCFSRSSSPRKSAPPPVSTMPRSMTSPESSGGVLSSVVFT